MFQYRICDKHNGYIYCLKAYKKDGTYFLKIGKTNDIDRRFFKEYCFLDQVPKDIISFEIICVFPVIDYSD